MSDRTTPAITAKRLAKGGVNLVTFADYDNPGKWDDVRVRMVGFIEKCVATGVITASQRDAICGLDPATDSLQILRILFRYR